MANCENCPKRQGQARARYVAPKRETPLVGILNVDKPPGVTSHDVVDVIRRVTGQRKVGHAGTLDPMATGVLLVCLGQATRVAEYLMAGRKRYRATVLLGSTTDTYDAEGQVLESGGRTDFGRGEIEQALASLTGQIDQVPPAYSAIKRGGQPVHRLARQGKPVELEPRPVDIYEVDVLDWTPPALLIEVECSPGTYIRSLAHDLGQRVGSGAYLGALVRLRSGHFRLEEAVSLARLEEAFEHGEGERYLLPMDEALLDWPAVVVDAGQARRISQGQAIERAGAEDKDEDDSLWRAYSLDGDFLAVMDYDPESGVWRPKKVFASG
jgi:tRNA pseudouridine55 synthase